VTCKMAKISFDIQQFDLDTGSRKRQIQTGQDSQKVTKWLYFTYLGRSGSLEVVWAQCCDVNCLCRSWKVSKMTASIEVSTTMLSTLRNEILLLVMLHLAWSGITACCANVKFCAYCHASCDLCFQCIVLVVAVV